VASELVFFYKMKQHDIVDSVLVSQKMLYTTVKQECWNQLNNWSYPPKLVIAKVALAWKSNAYKW